MIFSVKVGSQSDIQEYDKKEYYAAFFSLTFFVSGKYIHYNIFSRLLSYANIANKSSFYI